MKRSLLLLPFLLAMVACSSMKTYPVAPHFATPSTAAITQSATAVRSHIQAAQKINQDIAKIPLAQAYSNQLDVELNAAYGENEKLSGQVAQLTTQLTDQTNSANALATDYTNLTKDAYRLQGVVKTQNTHLWKLRKYIGILLLTNLLSIAWIFRRPIGAMFGI